jgi:hypothetical protein
VLDAEVVHGASRANLARLHQDLALQVVGRGQRRSRPEFQFNLKKLEVHIVKFVIPVDGSGIQHCTCGDKKNPDYTRHFFRGNKTTTGCSMSPYTLL